MKDTVKFWASMLIFWGVLAFLGWIEAAYTHSSGYYFAATLFTVGAFGSAYRLWRSRQRQTRTQ
jgi:hypothetical protein